VFWLHRHNNRGPLIRLSGFFRQGGDCIYGLLHSTGVKLCIIRDAYFWGSLAKPDPSVQREDDGQSRPTVNTTDQSKGQLLGGGTGFSSTYKLTARGAYRLPR